MRARGSGWIAGVDEAGRGPLAGPVVAAAVIFPAGFTHPRHRRLQASRRPRREALVPGHHRRRASGGRSPSRPTAEIDAINILQATLRAMERALAALRAGPGLRAGRRIDHARSCCFPARRWSAATAGSPASRPPRSSPRSTATG